MNPFFIIFIGIPALEIFLLIKIGGQIGALNTLALIFLTAVIGVYFAKLQGIQTLKSGMINIYQNKMPIYEIMSGGIYSDSSVVIDHTWFFYRLYWFSSVDPFYKENII